MIDQNSHQLIQKHLDGLTSESEAELLSEYILKDPEFRAQYLRSARLHAALADESLLLPNEPDQEDNLETFTCSLTHPRDEQKAGKPHRLLNARHLQVAAALGLGLFIGMMGLGGVKATDMPRSEEKAIDLANGDFERLELGRLTFGFPNQFDVWQGDPAEIVKNEDNTQRLRFLETANVVENPNGLATACNLFQLIDLTNLQKQQIANPDTQFMLELSALFDREASPTDQELPKPHVSIAIHLYKAPPESIGQQWPAIINEALAIGKKGINIKPGKGPTRIAASCLLDPDANIALISLNVNSGRRSPIPLRLGGYYVDDVKLSLVKQPKLPVHSQSN